MKQNELVMELLAAAEQGDSDAQYNLGVCYQKGQSVEQDYEEAMRWLHISAAQVNLVA